MDYLYGTDEKGNTAYFYGTKGVFDLHYSIHCDEYKKRILFTLSFSLYYKPQQFNSNKKLKNLKGSIILFHAPNQM